MSALKYVSKDGALGLRVFCDFARNVQSDIEVADAYGNTALLKACYLGNLEAVQILLSCNANISAINYFGQNALTLATYSGNVLLIKELLKHRSYDDFNLSSMIPALCVATLTKNNQTIEFLKGLQSNDSDMKTSHGLSSEDIQKMLDSHYKCQNFC